MRAKRGVKLESISPAGRCFLSLFLSVFILAGGFFGWLVGRQFFRAVETHRWTQTPCVILESGVPDRERGRKASHHFKVRYRYEWQGRTHFSEKYSLQEPAYSDYTKARRLAERFPADSNAVCYVNPKNPDEALLVRGNRAIGFAVLFPLVFMAVPGLILAALWWPGRKQTEEAASRRPISSRVKGRFGRAAQAGFFLIFLVMGAGAFQLLVVAPLRLSLAARSWAPTPCTILSSEVRSHSGSDSTTYSVDILYAYEVNGREYRSNRYSVMTGSSSGHKGKAEIVRRHREGSQATCFVDPADPNEALLSRELPAMIWFGLIPAVFIVIGLVGFIHTLRGPKRPGVSSQPAREVLRINSSGRPPSPPEMTGALTLKPAQSRHAVLIGVGIFAVIWNSVIFFGFLKDSPLFRRGGSGPDWFMLVFMLPFVGVGLFLIGIVIYQALGLFNPRPELTVTPGTPAPGGPLLLAWRLNGRVERLRQLKITLQAREEATYRRGTTTSTDKETFLTLAVAEYTGVSEMRAGQKQIHLPAGAMPTFKGTNNKIIWAIHVAGSIPRWPDVKEEFELHVRPAALPPAPSASTES